MRVSLWLVSTALLAAVLCAQENRIRYIPALAYGPNIWSIVRLSNSGAASQPAQVDVYRESGERLPIGPTFEVMPGATRDIRIDGAGAATEMCWARVALPAGVEARGIVEILEGNALEEFPREPHELSDNAQWVALSSRVQGKQIYFLNAADKPTLVAFCAANRSERDACGKKGNAAARFLAGPNQSVSVQVRKLRRKLFITESSAPGRALLLLFDNSPGTTRIFGSKSSIEFGGALP